MYTFAMSERTPGAEPVEVGVRALRADLAHWLEAARTSDVVITERGTPVARLVPIGEHPGLQRLIARGGVIPPRRPATRIDLSKLPAIDGTLSEFVREQRR
jgi:prevent-host-death family protein